MSTTILLQSQTRFASATRSLIPLHTSSPVYPQSTQSVYTSPTPFLPVIDPVETRITIVALVASFSLILLITCLLVLLLYLMAVKMRIERAKRYSNFPGEDPTPLEREGELIQEESKYNPMYISDNIRDSLTDVFLQKLLTAISTGKEVQASQDYFEPGREADGPIFFKGDHILILKIEEEVHKGQTTVWLRGEANDREVFFPSYIINLDNLEDTFDTLSSPVRYAVPVDGLDAQDSAVSMDSAPAELESLFHDVDYSFTPHSIALTPLSRRELAKQRRASHSDISHREKIIKRPTRRAPAPPSNQLYPLPNIPSKHNRPKLSSQKSGSKGTNELLFVPPPLSSSTPLRHPEPKPRPKRISGLVAHRARRPDTPVARLQPKSRKIPDWVMTLEPPPSRPDPPYTPSTLSFILYATTPDEAPNKPPPPTSYGTKPKLTI